jgi:hypothetical protein
VHVWVIQPGDEAGQVSSLWGAQADALAVNHRFLLNTRID